MDKEKHKLEKGECPVHDKHCGSDKCYWTWETITFEEGKERIKEFHCKALKRIEGKALKK